MKREEPTALRIYGSTYSKLATIKDAASKKIGRKVTWQEVMQQIEKNIDKKEVINALVNI